jgi:hypothetical protein
VQNRIFPARPSSTETAASRRIALRIACVTTLSSLTKSTRLRPAIAPRVPPHLRCAYAPPCLNRKDADAALDPYDDGAGDLCCVSPED